MGIYWLTCFYSDVDRLEESITLANIDPIIDDGDIQQGYVRKEDLLHIFGTRCKITADMITEKSYLIEYTWTSLEMNSGKKETRRLPVK